MAAQIIPLRGAQNVETPVPLHPPLQAAFRASVGGAARRWWHRARLFVEAVGWIVVAASVIAAVR